MNIKEYFTSVETNKINEDIEKTLKDLYGHDFPDIITIIASTNSDSVFVDDYRVLSGKEIIDFNGFWDIDMAAKGMIPVIDLMGCSYLVYVIDSKKWSIYNTIDDSIYDENDDLYQLI